MQNKVLRATRGYVNIKISISVYIYVGEEDYG